MLFAVIVSLSAVAILPAEANCGMSRRFSAGFAHLSMPLKAPQPFVGFGAFWARGFGIPAPGLGIDNGSYSPYYPGSPSWIRYGYYLDGDWNQSGVDGCIDVVGATPNLDGDECMVIAFSDELENYYGAPFYPIYGPDFGAFALLSQPAAPGADPGFEFNPRDIDFAAIPRPTITAISAGVGLVDVAVDAGPGLSPKGQYLDPACSTGLVTGYRVFGLEVPAGSGTPFLLKVEDGWTGLTSTGPFGTEVSVTLDCASGKDVYLATVAEFDSGYSTGHVSGASRRINTATDSDLDTLPDACDSCTDLDGDGFGDPDLLSNSCGPDNCPDLFNPLQIDTDGDGVGDSCDVCAAAPDPGPAVIVSELGANTEHHLAEFAISDDGQHVVYDAFVEPGGFALHSVMTSGGPSVRIAGPFASGVLLRGFAISPDGSRVVYIADQDTDDDFELYSVPIGGGTVVKLNGPLQVGEDITSLPWFVDTPSGTDVVFRSRPTLFLTDIYRVPIDGSSAAIKLNPDNATGVPVMSPDQMVVVYEFGDELLAVPTDGGGPVTNLTGPVGNIFGVIISADSRTIVFSVFVGDGIDLYAVPITGGGATRIAANVSSPFRISPDSSTVVYSDTPDGALGPELFSVTITGGSATQLTQAPNSRGALGFQISADSSRVAYLSADFHIVFDDLMSVPISGGQPIRLSHVSDVQRFTLASDGIMAVYQLDPAPGLFSVPIGGGTVNTLTSDFARIFELAPDGRSVIFMEGDAKRPIFSVPMLGGPAIKLSDTPDERVFDFRMSTDGRRVVYKAEPGLLSTPVHTASDVDADTILDGCDQCSDTDGDSFGDPGFAANTCATDNCPTLHNSSQADADGDGHGDVCDNCPATPFPTQFDADADGEGDACDCAPDDPGVLSPNAIPGLSLEHLTPTEARLTWQGVAGADQYSVTRGTASALAAGQYGSCVADGIGIMAFDDADLPAPGDAFIYQVQGKSLACGIGTMGFTSGGAERNNLDAGACP